MNRAKFDACTCSSLRGVKTDTLAGRPTEVRFIQGVHKVFRQLKKFIDITTDVENV